jgi:hypothetical protein
MHLALSLAFILEHLFAALTFYTHNFAVSWKGFLKPGSLLLEMDPTGKSYSIDFKRQKK